jgi:predicted acetyltransferase
MDNTLKKSMTVNLIPADIDSKAVIQNMARFYANEMSKYCGFDGVYDWSFSEDGFYEANDFSRYWQQPGCYPFLIRIENEHESELGGFALINKEGISQDSA